jgi:hypothetical protein
LRIVKIYSVAMSNFVVVQIRGAASPTFVKADKAEEDTGTNQLTVYKDGKAVGHFKLDEIAGWWLAD